MLRYTCRRSFLTLGLLLVVVLLGSLWAGPVGAGETVTTPGFLLFHTEAQREKAERLIEKSYPNLPVKLGELSIILNGSPDDVALATQVAVAQGGVVGEDEVAMDRIEIAPASKFLDNLRGLLAGLRAGGKSLEWELLPMEASKGTLLVLTGRPADIFLGIQAWQAASLTVDPTPTPVPPAPPVVPPPVTQPYFLRYLAPAMARQFLVQSRPGLVVSEGVAPGEALPSKLSFITVTGNAEDQLWASAQLTALDVAPHRVRVEAMLMSLTPRVLRKLAGTDEPNAPGFWLDTVREVHLPKVSAAFLKQLIDDGSAAIVASPSVTVLDRAAASIFIGEQPAGGSEGPGIRLMVQPTVHTAPPGFAQPPMATSGTATTELTLKLSSELSTLLGYDRGEHGAKVPRLQVNRSETTLRVRDGEDTWLGGMIVNRETLKRKKIPVLGSLPLLGSIFRYKGLQHDEAELVLLVRAHVLTEGEQ